jgi:spore coat polysaccharide biosynthesis protein SpsF
MIGVFVQARMSSSRFPGKVLAPFKGRPMILHVLQRVRTLFAMDSIVVLTSSEETDDPLVSYLEKRGVNVFRGPLTDVFQRFRMCALQFPCEWILRLSADSPLLDASLLERVLSFSTSEQFDLVTTIHPRTFPKGQNAELIRVATFVQIDPEELTPHDREHVTPYFYRHPNRFRIMNLESGDPELAATSLAVDTIDDLRRLERLATAEMVGQFPAIVT